VLLVLIRLEMRRGNTELVEAYTNELLKFNRHNTGGLGHPMALSARFQLALMNLRDAEAESIARQTIELARQTGERGLLFGAFDHLIISYLLRGQYVEAEHAARQSLEQARVWQNTGPEIVALQNLVRVSEARQDWQAGQSWLTQVLEADRRRAKGDPSARAYELLASAGKFYAAQGDWARANQYFHEAISSPELENDATELVYILLAMAGPLAWRGELELLAELVGALESMPMLYTPWDERLFINPYRHQLDLSEPALAAAYQRGLEQGPMPLRQHLVDLWANASLKTNAPRA
jgi:tetratricopeptide (TPR) repeat protein